MVTQVFPSNSSITYPFNSAGTYTIVTKINNIPLTAGQVLNQPNQFFTINVQQPTPNIFVNNIIAPNPLIICNGQSETICADQTYPSYLWSTGATTQCINVNLAGNYSLIVTDNIGCTGITDVDVQVISCCSLTVDLTAESACLPATVGTITGGIVNGIAPFNIVWQQIAGGTASGTLITSLNPFTIPNLAPGTYSVTVTDVNGCTDLATVTILSGVNPPLAMISGSNVACFQEGINVPYSISNANQNYTYTWSSIPAPAGWNITPPLSISTTNQFSQTVGDNTLITFPVPSGPNSNYLIQVITTDQNGCISTSIFPVNWCCQASTNADHVWVNESATNVATPTNGETVIIRGVFQVDINTVWDHVIIEMDPGAQITVKPGNELFINGTTVTLCETFWRSILVDNGLVRVHNSTIEGGQYAIDVINGGGYVIQKGNTLQDNYVSLRVTGNSGAYPRMINNTTITKTSLVYDVYTDFNGQNPSTCFGVAIGDAPQNGILLIEAGQITIGANTPNLPIHINNVFIGIESINTNVTIVNTKIAQLINRPCIPLPQWSRAGIYSHGMVRSTIVNSPAPSNCTFNNCRTGIFGDDVELIASNNYMDNVTFGVQHINPPSILTNKMSLISNNTIKATFEGIRITSTSGRNHHTNVRGNYIVALSGAPNGAGIRWEDFIIAGKQNDISGNIISLSNNFRWGIRFLNHNDFSCKLNTVTLNSSGQINGINAVGSRDFTINENSVTDLFSSSLSRGINIQTSGNANLSNKVQCNTVGNCQMDFLFDQSNLNVDWASNTMNGGRTGLRLQNGTVLNRNQPWNWWCGNFTNWWINSVGLSFANWIQDNVSNAGCITRPSTILGQIGGSGINFSQANSTDPGCPRPIVVDPLEISDQDRWIATDSNWTVMEENMLWQYRRSLADKLVMNPTLISSDSIVNSFWQNYLSLDEIKLAGLMRKVVLMDSLTRANYGTMAQYTDSVNDVRTPLNFNDSLLMTGLSNIDSMRILEENIFYSNQMAAWCILSDSLFYIFNQQLKIYRDGIYQLYEAFTPQTERGNTEKSIWKLILTYGLGSNVKVTDQDSLLMAQYANLCMLEYGASIAAMRSFYESYTGLIIDDEDVCVSGERIRNNTTPSSESKGDFTLIPNPTQNNVQVITQNLNEEEYTLSVFNPQGLLMIKQTSHAQIINLAIDGFSAGVYYVNIRWSEGLVTKKLIVLK